MKDLNPDSKEVSRDKLIARIQCFDDLLHQWYHDIQEPDKYSEDDEHSKAHRKSIAGFIGDTIEAYEDLFGDITVCKYDGKGY